MTASDETLSRVIDILAETIQGASGRTIELDEDTALLTTGYLDSLAVLQLFTSLQEVFEVELDISDVTEEAFSTPKSIAELVEERS